MSLCACNIFYLLILFIYVHAIFSFYVICLVDSMVAQPQAGIGYDLPAFVDEL